MRLAGLSAEELPDTRLRSLWKALDQDGSGYVTAGEFGQFMRLGARQPKRVSTQLRRQQSAAAVYHRHAHEEALSTALQLRRSNSAVQQHQDEAAKLRAELAQIRRDASARPSTAPLGRVLAPPSRTGSHHRLVGRAASAAPARSFA